VAARTAAPDAPATTPISPNRDPEGPPSPVLAWPSEWPVPQPPEQPRQTRGRNGRGLPMAPTLAAAGNATSLLATGAYAAGGVVGVAATGALAAAGATAAVVRRRKTVRRNMASRRMAPPSIAGLHSGGASRGASRGGSGLGLLGAPGRSGGGSRGASGGGSTDSAYRRSGRLGGGAFDSSGRPAKGAGKSATGLSGGAGADLSSLKLPKQKHGKKDRHKKKNHGLAAAVGRTARGAAKPGSKPRKALAAMGHGTVAATKATGRGLRKAATADATKKAARAARAGAKKLRGAAVDGVRSVLAAAWTGLRKRSGRAALTRLKETWSRRRKRRADKDAAKTKAAKATPPPTVAATVRRPTATTAPATASTGGTTMPGHHFVAPAMEAARIAANYDPQGMMQVGEDFAGLEEALRLYAEAMKITVENADAKQPLDPRIVEIMRGIHALQLKAAEMATELRPAFESLHQVDLDRLRNPRKGAAGERKWDVTTNLGNH
jgi:hypothetical protein